MIDYDDIIENCFKLLKSNKRALNYLHKKFSHILVDEFQDINSLQYETLKLMAGKAGMIFAVGDEDQSIYGFRGASPDIMKRFLNDYSNATVINLNKNYRSFQDISDFSQKVIKNNPGRLRTDIPTCLKTDNRAHVHLKVFKDRNEEIAELLKDLYKDGEESKSAAVLLRTNKEVYEFNKLLSDSGRDDKTLKRVVIEDYLALIEYLLKRDIGSLKRIMSITVPGIPTVILKDCESLNDIKRKLMGTAKGDAVAVFETKLKVMGGLNPFSFALYARNIVGLYEYHKNNFGGVSDAALVRVFDEITDISKNNKDFNDFKATLESIKPIKTKSDAGKNRDLTITTFHQAKGLEFDRVFIPDAVEGKIPAGMSVAECRVEEERRLFYVALTRAKNELFVYTIKNEASGGALPSRFLNDFIY